MKRKEEVMLAGREGARGINIKVGNGFPSTTLLSVFLPRTLFIISIIEGSYSCEHQQVQLELSSPHKKISAWKVKKRDDESLLSELHSESSTKYNSNDLSLLLSTCHL